MLCVIQITKRNSFFRSDEKKVSNRFRSCNVDALFATCFTIWFIFMSPFGFNRQWDRTFIDLTEISFAKKENWMGKKNGSEEDERQQRACWCEFSKCALVNGQIWMALMKQKWENMSTKLVSFFMRLILDIGWESVGKFFLMLLLGKYLAQHWPDVGNTALPGPPLVQPFDRRLHLSY